MQELNRTLPMPYILHFRIPSTGTPTSWLACHPFPIEPNVELSFDGKIEGFVLFHNGFWADWKKKMETLALHGAKKIPSGMWSDSRGLAWVANHLSMGMLDIIDEKVAVLGPEVGDLEIYGHWTRVKVTGSEETILVSNTVWEKPVYTKVQDFRTPISELAQRAITPASSAAGGVTEIKLDDAGTGGSSPLLTFPVPDGGPRTATEGGSDKQESIQEAAEAAHSAGVQGEGTTAQIGSMRHKCYVCAKASRKDDADDDGNYRCWQCWASFKRMQESHGKLGTCQTCKVSVTGQKCFNTDDWMCSTCWEGAGHPAIYWPGTMHHD